MLELANKLRMLYGNPFARREDMLQSTIFGSMASVSRFLDLNRARVRVGMWPLLSSSAPQPALGIACVLGFLLEDYQDVEVYRLLARLEGGAAEAATYKWILSDSQFTVDDWQLDPLGENVGLWGSLEQEGGQWRLKLEVENDLIEDSDTRTFAYDAPDLAGLCALLPQAAADIAGYLETGEIRPTAARFDGVKASDEALHDLLKYGFQWDLKLLLLLWGQDWPEEQILGARKDLLAVAKRVSGTFGAWLVSKAVARAMLPGFQPVGETLTPGVPEIIETFPDSATPSIVLALALYRLDYKQEAFDLLEECVESHPEDVTAWLTLAELYLAGRQLLQVTQTFRRAINADTVNVGLFMRYAQILRLLDLENWILNDFVLINPDNYDEADLVLFEAIEAYEEVLEIDPKHEQALYQQLLLMTEVEDERFWPKFSQLVEADTGGEKVRAVIDALYNFEDMTEGIEALQEAAGRAPKRADLFVNLGAIYLMADEPDAARRELENARRLTRDEQVLADINRLMLSVEDPEFEAYLGEMIDIVNAGNELSSEDVEYLESILEANPRFQELVVLLAKAYLAWNEPSTALESLLDGQKQFPDDPEIAELLGRVLWESDAHDLAFEYLNKGLAKNPLDVPLLARMGRCLFDDDQIDLSKAYLLRAEAINPRHPALNETRMYISRMLESSEDD